MAAISLGTDQYVGVGNFPQGMVKALVADLVSKNITLTVQGPNVVVMQGGAPVGTFDLRDGGEEVWASLAAVLFAGASVQDVHTADRIVYSEGYSRAIDWRDMSQSTTQNENRFIDGALSISVNAAAFTVSGFGTHFQKVVGMQLQRNDASNSFGAMMEIGVGNEFIRINSSNHIEVNTAVGSGTPSFTAISDANGPIALSTGTNFLVFEMVRVPGSSTQWEVIADVFDGTTYHEANNIRFTPSSGLTGDNLGFSRSSAQRGQILRFSAIDSAGYLRHDDLDQYLRQHTADKFNFGLARLISGGTERRVALTTPLSLAPGTNVAGEDIFAFRSATVQPQPDIRLGNSETGTGLITGAANTFTVGASASPSTSGLPLRLDNTDNVRHRIPTGATYNAATGALRLPAGHYMGSFRCILSNSVAGGVDASTARCWPLALVRCTGNIVHGQQNAYIRYASNATLANVGDLSYEAYVDVPVTYVSNGSLDLFCIITGIAQNNGTVITVTQAELTLYRV